MHLNAFIAHLCCVEEIYMYNRYVMRYDAMRMLDCKQDVENRLMNSNKNISNFMFSALRRLKC